MPIVKIKQLDDRVSTMGLHMGGGHERRKLEPGEVVEIPDDLVEKGVGIMEVLWGTGHLEITRESVTRPLDYAGPREAALCSPTFKSTGPSDDADRDTALAAVGKRLDAAQAEKTPSMSTVIETEKGVREAPTASASNRRAERRAATKATQSG